MATILLLEDFRVLREELSGFLTERGHAVTMAENVREFEQRYRRGGFAVLIFDLGLPDGDGLELIERLREEGDPVGIVVLTSRAGSARKIEGFASGADHYLVKPVDLDELDAVVTAVARRMVGLRVAGLPTVEPKPRWAIDTLQRCLITPDGAAIELTAQGLIVLAAIAQGRGRAVHRRAVVEALGANYIEYDQRRLDSQVYQLRKIVKDRSGLDLPLRSARGLGYQITAEFDVR